MRLRRIGLLSVLVLALAFIQQACSREEQINEKLFGRWKTAKSEPLGSQEAIIYYIIAKNGDEGRLVTHLEVVKGNTPFLENLIGDQTFSIKAVGDGMLESDNVDKSAMSRVTCFFIDCETVVLYEFSDDDTVTLSWGGEEKRVLLRQ